MSTVRHSLISPFAWLETKNGSWCPSCPESVTSFYARYICLICVVSHLCTTSIKLLSYLADFLLQLLLESLILRWWRHWPSWRLDSRPFLVYSLSSWPNLFRWELNCRALIHSIIGTDAWNQDCWLEWLWSGSWLSWLLVSYSANYDPVNDRTWELLSILM